MMSKSPHSKRDSKRKVAAWAAVALIMMAQGAHAQLTVGGTVVEGTTRIPLDGARVLLDGTTRGAVTDNRGRFTITGVPGATANLRVTKLGFRELRQTVQTGRTDLVLMLDQTAVTLDATVVTGTPEAVSKRSLGNSIGMVDVAKKVEEAPPPTVQKLLGAATGVAILSGGGDVGAGASTRIRGVSSMTLSAEPLIYVDGVRANSLRTSGPGVDSRYPQSPMNDLDPNEIESIEIIKGPAAATLYGTEASNGVVNIITKRGRLGAPVVVFNVKRGANWLPNPETLWPSTYYKNAAGQIVEFNALRSDRITGEYPGDTISYGPWFRTGQPQGYEGTVTGGTEALRYFFAGGWDRDEGPVTYNWKNRLNTRANVNWAPTDKLSVDVGLSFVKSNYRSAGAAQPISVTIIWACASPGCEPGRRLPGGVDGPTRGYLTGPPERYEQDYEGYEDEVRGLVTSTIHHQPFSWFSHRLTVGGDFANGTLSSLSRKSTTIGASLTGSRSVEVAGNNLVSLDYAGTVTKEIGGLTLKPSVGLQYYDRTNTTATATGSTFPIRALETVSAGSIKSATETFVENKTVGAFFQQQIEWKNRVFLTGAVRGDDNSAFGANYNFVAYPKVSASWVISEEPFFGRVPLLNSLKLRSAWGRAGQQPDAFAAARTYQPTVGPGGVSTLSPENLGNPDLSPEVGTELEAGLDASVVNDRVGIEFTYYNKKTKDAIVSVPNLPSLGFPGNQYRNIGAVANRGLELGLTADAIHRENLGLNLRFKLSHNTNEVLSLGGPASLVLNAPFGSYNVTGFPIGAIFMTRVLSADIDRSGATPRAINMMCESGTVIPRTNFSAGGGPPVPCAQAPAVYWGSPNPTFEGAFSGQLTLYKNLQLYANAEFVGGNTLSSGDIRASLMSFRNQVAIIEAKDPILLAYDILDIRRQPGMIKGGFAKLRDVSATYTFSPDVAKSAGLSRASVTVSAMNLWTIWRAQLSDFGVRHTDAEVRNVTDPSTAYFQEGWPQLRRFLVTLRMTR